MRKANVLAAAALTCALIASGCGQSTESPGQASSTPAAAPAAAKPPIGFLNSPTEGQTVTLDPAKPFFGTGWALADSGIADVSVLFDDGQKGYVRMGFAFPGVKEQFPNYPDGDKPGYMFGIPKLSPGPHSLTVTITSKDGGTTQVLRHFSIS